MQNPLELILARKIETGVRDESNSTTKPPLIRKSEKSGSVGENTSRKILHKSTTLKVVL